MSASIRPKPLLALSVGILSVALQAIPSACLAEAQRVRFQANNNSLTLEFLRDDLLHFEVSAVTPSADLTVFTSPQVAKTDYPGPSSFAKSGPGGSILDTGAMKVVVNPGTLCMTVTDKAKNLELSSVCPTIAADKKTLSLSPGVMQNVYGLGEQFISPGNPDGDWTAPGHQQRSPGDSFGNKMTGFNGGSVGNAQFPILYAVGPNSSNYALFLDHLYPQRWDFGGNPWKVETVGDAIRGYFITGPNLPDLRQDYMELTGRPPVPPKKMFGLWVSEYGFDNWQEVDGKLSALRTDKFPVDGFVLDLQWFGGVPDIGTNPSRMGSLGWDASRFPNPSQHLADYKNNEGLGFITIEESYIDSGLPEHADLKAKGYLVRKGCESCDPVFFNPDWWGKGSMVDWTLTAGADYWHDLKRKPLIKDGVVGHWIDLGEPEIFDGGDWVAGILPGKHRHMDYHNAYSLKWAESIARGYVRNGEQQRPFIMARSGASGIQRFGTGLWSGDIGSNVENLATHLNAQMHMAMSGVDYFGADIGGFHRGALNGEDLNRVYTQWFANGMAFDVPGRPHTENKCNCKETAPDKIGDKASNLANLRQRYALTPYLYSLAHRAYQAGEPVVPPLVYYYQDDPNVRRLGNEKLLGRDLLVAASADRNAPQQRDVYLPAGDWVDYHSNAWFHSTGQTFPNQPLFRNGLFQLPVYAKGGAIIPKMAVDDKTLNVAGKRSDGSLRNELIARVYAQATPSSFTLFEDDGETIAYQGGAVRSTLLSQQLAADGKSATVTVAAASGSYAGAPTSRDNVVELVTDGAQGKAVALNGAALAQHPSQAAFDAAASGWLNAGTNLILAKSGSQPTGQDKTFTFTLEPAQKPPVVTASFQCANGTTVFGQSVYVVGGTPALGDWNPAKAVKLEPTGPYPIWVSPAKISLPTNASIAWKCIKRPENAAAPVVWEPDPDNVLKTPASGDAGVAKGDFNGDGSPVAMNFICDNGTTQVGQSVYVVGGNERLGNWDPAKAVKLEPTQYPRWTGTIANWPAGLQFEWKCIKRPENAASPVVWEPDPNNVSTTPASGTGTASGGF